MPETIHDLTNGELWSIIIDKNHLRWQQAVSEMDDRLEAANAKGGKGFETPPPPPNP